MGHGLTAVIDRIEGDLLVVKLSDGQQLLWPKNMADNNLKEGDSVNLFILSRNDGGNEATAKELLKQIFKTDA